MNNSTAGNGTGNRVREMGSRSRAGTRWEDTHLTRRNELAIRRVDYHPILEVVRRAHLETFPLLNQRNRLVAISRIESIQRAWLEVEAVLIRRDAVVSRKRIKFRK